MAIKTQAEVGSASQVYTVRKGMVLHKERLGPKNKILTDIFDGDDPSNNEVELMPQEVDKYLHQLEALDPDTLTKPKVN